MKHVLSTLCVLLFPLLAQAGGADVVIENAAVRLVIGADGAARSLIHKSTGEECLAAEVRTPICAITQYRPYDNENFLIYPAKPRVFPACRVERRGDRLYVGFEDTYDIAVIRLDIEDDYIGFSLERVDYRIEAYGVKRQTEIDEFALLRLPLRPRAHFGEWLNVVWDDRVAVNLLGTHPGTRIDAFPTAEATTLYAGLDAQVGLFGPGAALVVSSREGLLPAIGQIERDYDLPRGVESRRDGSYRCSYYSLRGVTPENIDAHIEYARRGGFRTMMVYYVDFARSCGHYGWREEYPGGMEDLRYVTDRIRAAGMIPGLHFHYSKVGVNDPYINGGHPDTRMNSVCELVLAEPAGAADTVLVVEGNTQGLRREEGRRLLHLGDELISYADCTTRPPYMLTGCRRGLHNSQPAAHAAGSRARLLDVDDWPLFVRIDQNTGIQREIAGRLGRIYAEAGFRFVYFDGAEDVPMPYWYNVSRSQSVVYDALRPAPLFAEGALKSHFGWHILSRGNAFDIFPPEYIRPAMKKYTLRCPQRRGLHGGRFRMGELPGSGRHDDRHAARHVRIYLLQGVGLGCSRVARGQSGGAAPASPYGGQPAGHGALGACQACGCLHARTEGAAQGSRPGVFPFRGFAGTLRALSLPAAYARRRVGRAGLPLSARYEELYPLLAYLG